MFWGLQVVRRAGFRDLREGKTAAKAAPKRLQSDAGVSPKRPRSDAEGTPVEAKAPPEGGKEDRGQKIEDGEGAKRALVLSGWKNETMETPPL